MWLLVVLNIYPKVSESCFLSLSAAMNQTGLICDSPHTLIFYTQFSNSPENTVLKMPIWQVSIVLHDQASMSNWVKCKA